MADLETDYFVIGTGAMGMSFVDTLLTETDADIVMVDKHHAPGGHWNDAYPFVRLHQPSSFYGVASTPLGSNRIDEVGPNKGYFELASGPEILAYFESVMRERFLPSGRVRYFPMHEVVKDNALRSSITGAETGIHVRAKTVDSTYLNTTVPSTHERKFEVEEGVVCVAPGELPRRAPSHRSFVILGGGKTAMDVGVWLLDNGVAPDSIYWVCPRGSWLINRDTTQPTADFFVQSIGGFARQLTACAQALDVDDLFDRLESSGNLLRIDKSQRPSMFHFATISTGEVEQLQRIKNIIQAGHVSAITSGEIILAEGQASAPENALYIDCTATAVERRPVCPIFAGNRITLQMVRLPNPCLSAALAAYLEAHYQDETEKNRLCEPVPICDTPEEWPAAQFGNMKNQLAWSQEKPVRDFITNCRLDGFGQLVRDVDRSNAAHMEIVKTMREAGMPAAMNLQKIMAAQG